MVYPREDHDAATTLVLYLTYMFNKYSKLLTITTVVYAKTPTGVRTRAKACG